VEVGDGQAVAFERDQIGAAVRQQHHVGYAEVDKDLRADADAAQLLVAAPFARADAAGEDHDDARAMRSHCLHGALERALARAGLAQHIVEHRDRMDAGEGGLAGDDMAFLEDIGLVTRHPVAIGDHPPLAAVIALEAALAQPFDEVIIAHPVSDEIADRADLQVMLAREADEIVEAGHGAVLVHDLADHPRGVEASQPRDVDRRFGVAGAHQCAAITRHQREDVAGGNEIIRALGRVDRNGDRARPVCRRDAGGDAFLRLDRDGEGGLHRFLVVAAHRFEPEQVDAFLGEREADEAAPVHRHEVDRLRGRHLRGDDEIAFVLAVLVVDEDVHPAVARLVDDLFDRCEHRLVVIGVEEGFELGEGLGGGIPARFGAIAQGVGVEPSGAGEASACHGARCDEIANACDERCVHTGDLSHQDVIARQGRRQSRDSGMANLRS
jgi:hypothetical protein